MRVQANTLYPTRVKILLEDLWGPLYSTSLGYFDPSRDVRIYCAGRLHQQQTFNYDAVSNAYTVYLAEPMAFDGPIQVIHHMPASPFLSAFRVTAAAPVVMEGQTLQFTTLFSQGGEEVLWSTSAGSIDTNGLLTAPNVLGPVIVTAALKKAPSITSSKTIDVIQTQSITTKLLNDFAVPTSAPTITVDGPSSVAEGSLVPFSASGGPYEGSDISFEWVVSGGTITDGVGTAAILVRVTAAAGSTVSARVTIRSSTYTGYLLTAAKGANVTAPLVPSITPELYNTNNSDIMQVGPNRFVVQTHSPSNDIRFTLRAPTQSGRSYEWSPIVQAPEAEPTFTVLRPAKCENRFTAVSVSLDGTTLYAISFGHIQCHNLVTGVTKLIGTYSGQYGGSYAQMAFGSNGELWYAPIWYYDRDIAQIMPTGEVRHIFRVPTTGTIYGLVHHPNGFLYSNSDNSNGGVLSKVTPDGAGVTMDWRSQLQAPLINGRSSPGYAAYGSNMSLDVLTDGRLVMAAGLTDNSSSQIAAIVAVDPVTAAPTVIFQSLTEIVRTVCAAPDGGVYGVAFDASLGSYIGIKHYALDGSSTIVLPFGNQSIDGPAGTATFSNESGLSDALCVRGDYLYFIEPQHYVVRRMHITTRAVETVLGVKDQQSSLEGDYGTATTPGPPFYTTWSYNNVYSGTWDSGSQGLTNSVLPLTMYGNSKIRSTLTITDSDGSTGTAYIDLITYAHPVNQNALDTIQGASSATPNQTGLQAWIDQDWGELALIHWVVDGGTITSGQGTYKITYNVGSTHSAVLHCTITSIFSNPMPFTVTKTVNIYGLQPNTIATVGTTTETVNCCAFAADGTLYAFIGSVNNTGPHAQLYRINSDSSRTMLPVGGYDFAAPSGSWIVQPGSISNTAPGMAINDANGDIWILTTARLYKYSAQNQVVELIAGSFSDTGLTDGTGVAATLWRPTVGTVGPDGTLYFMDDAVLRKCTPGGVVTFIAGGISGGMPVSDHVDGVGANARFLSSANQGQSSSGLAISADGSTLYYTEPQWNTIRAIDIMTATVTTFAGNQSSHNGLIPANSPKNTTAINPRFSVAVNPDGTLYYLDSYIEYPRIVSISPAGLLNSYAGSGIYNMDPAADGVSDVTWTDPNVRKGEVLLALALRRLSNGNLAFVDGTRIRQYGTVQSPLSASDPAPDATITIGKKLAPNAQAQVTVPDQTAPAYTIVWAVSGACSIVSGQGTSTLTIQSGAPGTTGTVSVTVTSIDGFVASSSATFVAADFVPQPGSSFIELGKTYASSLDSSLPSDWPAWGCYQRYFYFDAVAGVALKTIGQTYGYARLLLYDPDNKLISDRSRSGSIDGTIWTDTLTKTGTYTLIVSSVSTGSTFTFNVGVATV